MKPFFRVVGKSLYVIAFIVIVPTITTIGLLITGLMQFVDHLVEGYSEAFRIAGKVMKSK